LDEAAAAEAHNIKAAMDTSGTEVMEEWDTEDDTQDLPQLAGLVIDDLVFEVSEGDGTVQQEGVEGSKDAEGGEQAGDDAVEGEQAGDDVVEGEQAGEEYLVG
jgi:hypothetical protein